MSTNKTSVDYTPVVVLYPRGGEWRTNCYKPNVHDPQTAVARLHGDMAAWCKPEDVPAVKEALRHGE